MDEKKKLDEKSKAPYIGAIAILAIILFLMTENYFGAMREINEMNEKFEKDLEEERQSGYEVGYEDGYAKGYDDGYVEAECLYDEY